MKNIEIIDAAGDVINTIFAGEAWAEENYPGAWRVAAAQPAEPEPAPAQRHVSVGAFKARLTADERKAIRALAKTDEDVYDYMDLLNSAQFVDLGDARTRGGLQYMEAVGVLATGRALIVLDAEIQPHESA